MYIEVEHPEIGYEVLPGIPWKLSQTPGEIRKHAPKLGEHNDYVLKELLGFSEEEVTDLTEKGALL